MKLYRVENGTVMTTECLCPDDCHCRAPWRVTVCGCHAHDDGASCYPPSLYTVELRHGAGRVRLSIYADSVESAASRVCDVERAPLSAVVSVSRS